MSIFASYVTRTVPLPFDVPHTVTIQKLSGRHVALARDKAREARTVASVQLVKTMGGAAAVADVAGLDQSSAVAAELDRRRTDPAQLYDRPTVLAKGVTGWTYDEPLTPDRLADLDEQASEFLFHAILDLTLPNGDAEKKTGS
jgi:hypothetical protein